MTWTWPGRHVESHAAQFQTCSDWPLHAVTFRVRRAALLRWAHGTTVTSIGTDRMCHWLGRTITFQITGPSKKCRRLRGWRNCDGDVTGPYFWARELPAHRASLPTGPGAPRRPAAELVVGPGRRRSASARDVRDPPMPKPGCQPEWQWTPAQPAPRMRCASVQPEEIRDKFKLSGHGPARPPARPGPVPVLGKGPPTGPARATGTRQARRRVTSLRLGP